MDFKEMLIFWIWSVQLRPKVYITISQCAEKPDPVLGYFVYWTVVTNMTKYMKYCMLLEMKREICKEAHFGTPCMDIYTFQTYITHIYNDNTYLPAHFKPKIIKIG